MPSRQVKSGADPYHADQPEPTSKPVNCAVDPVALPPFSWSGGYVCSDGLMATLAPGTEAVSPLAQGLVFRGYEDARILLAAMYGSLSRVRWHTMSSATPREGARTGRAHRYCPDAMVADKAYSSGTTRRMLAARGITLARECAGIIAVDIADQIDNVPYDLVQPDDLRETVSQG